MRLELRGAHTHTSLLYQQGKVFNQVGTSISGHLKHTKRMQSLVLSYFVILIQMFSRFKSKLILSLKYWLFAWTLMADYKGVILDLSVHS